MKLKQEHQQSVVPVYANSCIQNKNSMLTDVQHDPAPKENKLKIVLLDSPPCIQEELTDFGLHDSLLVGLHVDKDNEQLIEAIHQLNLVYKAVL